MLTVRGPSKPEEGYREQPHTNKRGQESSFRSQTPMFEAILLEQVCLNWHKQECDRDTNAEVQVGERGSNIAEAIIHNEHVEHTVEIEEQQPISKTIIKPQRDDNGLGEHDSQRHGGDEFEFTQHRDFTGPHCDIDGILIHAASSFDRVADH